MILSICVPTYNRPKELRRFLESLVPQMTADTECIIGDDGDFSVTEAVLKNFPGANITHFKNPNGPSFDVNLIAVTARASGDFVWWFGDDDVINPGAIRRVLDLLQQHPEIDFVWSNYSAFSHEKEPTRNLGPSRFFKDSNEALEKIGSPLGFISAIIFKRKLALPHLSTSGPYMGTGFFNLALVLQILSVARVSYYLHETFVLCYISSPAAPGVKDKPTYNGFQVFAINFYKVVKSFEGKGNLKNRSLKKCIAENFSHVWRSILVGRAKNGGELWAPRRAAGLLFPYYWNFPGYWAALPFFLMPASLERFLYKAYKALGLKI